MEACGGNYRAPVLGREKGAPCWGAGKSAGPEEMETYSESKHGMNIF